MVENTASRSKPDLGQTIGYSLGCLWLFFGLQFVVSGAISFVASLISESFGYRMSLGEQWQIASIFDALTLLAATGVSGLLTVYIGSRLFALDPLHSLAKADLQPGWIGQGICMTYSAAFVMGILVTVLNFALEFLFGAQAVSPEIGQTGWLDGTLNFVSVVFLAPVLEELIFRGLIFKGLSRFNAGFAVVFSALLFALAHLNLGQGLPVFGMGIVFGFLYYRSGSLKVPVIVHMINNFIALMISWIDLEIFATGMGLLILALVIAGFVFIVREKHQFAGMLRQCGQARAEWVSAAHKISFWILAVLFVLFSVGDIILSRM